MKKLIGICLVLALAVMLVPSAVFAFDFPPPLPPPPPAPPPTVSIDAGTDRLSNQVDGWFSSGTLNYNFNSTTPTHTAIATIDMNGSAFVQTQTSGKDTTTWHPGVVGETNYFQGASNGGFTATYNTSTNGNYGILGTYVNAASKAGGADFFMTDIHDFDIMSGNGNSDVVGNFMAHAAGLDANVIMKMASIGSMYIWSESEVYAYFPNPASGLQGNLIEKQLVTTQGATVLGNLYMGCETTGLAKSCNPSSWGWGDYQNGTATTNYGASQTMLATGAGNYWQNGFGKNYLNFNGGIAPLGGTGLMSFAFNGGLNQPYNMEAR
jgi:hypothetical protein